MPWPQLIPIMASFQVNIAPLNLEKEFNKAKSALKYFEAAALGVPVIASPVEDFQFAIRHAENGLLASNEEEWFDCLASLVESPEYRRQLGLRAQQDALERYTSHSQSLSTKATFCSILSPANKNC
jgi:glycosyltransferase involved in cell wall biosynthesis